MCIFLIISVGIFLESLSSPRPLSHLKAVKYCHTSNSAGLRHEDRTVLFSIPVSSCFELIPTFESQAQECAIVLSEFYYGKSIFV